MWHCVSICLYGSLYKIPLTSWWQSVFIHSTLHFFHGEGDVSLMEILVLDIDCGANKPLASNGGYWQLCHVVIIVSCTINVVVIDIGVRM
jgi:hypothetical protein